MTGVVHRTTRPLHAAFTAAVLSLVALQQGAHVLVSAWGNSNSNGYDTSIFGNALDRDWVYNSAGINIQVEGCLWAYWQDKDNDESGCLEESSEDGTTYWYQMSNCRRAQVVFSVYASDSSSSPSCNSGNFKETFVTKAGVSEFIYYMQSYDYNGGWSNDDGDGFNGEYPMCESDNDNGYGVGLTCASDGSFALEYFSDSYCLTRTGETYNQLYSLNQNLQTYGSCYNIYSSNNGDSSLVQYLISISDPCSALDSGLCMDNEAMQSRLSSSSTSSASHFHGSGMGGGKTWLTKLKYVVGGLLLLASFVMFTGILFTNRRRRRALMQRKYRQAKRHGEDRSRRSSRSKSKSRGDRSSKTRRSSKSREPRKSKQAAADDDGGIFT